MHFLVRMDVHLPPEMPAAQADLLRSREKAYIQKVQRDGRWVHLWSVVGKDATCAVFNVGSNDELHEILSRLPLFRYTRVSVTPLAQHPSAVSPEG